MLAPVLNNCWILWYLDLGLYPELVRKSRLSSTTVLFFISLPLVLAFVAPPVIYYQHRKIGPKQKGKNCQNI